MDWKALRNTALAIGAVLIAAAFALALRFGAPVSVPVQRPAVAGPLAAHAP